MQSWTYPYPVHHVTLPDVGRLAYVEEGAGEPTLLFVHGLGSNLQAWSKTIDGLKEDYRCVALDLPGYGKSARGDFPFSMAFFAETLAAFINQLGPARVVPVGHSMGGQIVLHLALEFPELVKKLVLIAPAGFETFTAEEGQQVSDLFQPDLLRRLNEEQIENNFRINFYRFPADARFMIDDRLRMREDPKEYDRFCRLVPACVEGMLREPVFGRLAEIEVPVLVIYGEDDRLIPSPLVHPDLSTAAVARRGTAELPQGQLFLLPAAGHFVQWERAAEVNGAMGRFLKDL